MLFYCFKEEGFVSSWVQTGENLLLSFCRLNSCISSSSGSILPTSFPSTAVHRKRFVSDRGQSKHQVVEQKLCYCQYYLLILS